MTSHAPAVGYMRPGDANRLLRKEGEARKKRGAPAPDDFRDAATKKADGQLVGTWYRCPIHGLTQETVVLGVVPYCSADDCTHQVVLAHSAMSDPGPESSDWNSPHALDRARRRRPEKAAAPTTSQEETVPRTKDDEGPMLKDVILEVLADGEDHPTHEIVDRVEELTGRGKSTSAILSQMKRRGFVMSPGMGVWQLAPRESDDAGEEGAETPGQASGDPEDVPPVGPDDSDMPTEVAPAPSPDAAPGPSAQSAESRGESVPAPAPTAQERPEAPDVSGPRCAACAEVMKRTGLTTWCLLCPSPDANDLRGLERAHHGPEGPPVPHEGGDGLRHVRLELDGKVLLDLRMPMLGRGEDLVPLPEALQDAVLKGIAKL